MESKLFISFSATKEFEECDYYFKTVVRQAILATLEYEDFRRDTEVSVTFCDNEYIKKINKEFRNKDSATDVLSFPLYDLSRDSDEPIIEEGPLALGDIVYLIPGAKYTSGKAIPAWVFNNQLYVRGINGDNITFSTLKTGAITGVTHKDNFTKSASSASAPKVEETFKPYTIKITADLLNVRAGAGTSYAINTTVRKNEVFTIVAEQNGWGQLKSGAGWINLKYAQKN